MWVRSQDKKVLIDAKTFHIDRDNGDYYIECYFNDIKDYFDYFCLGFCKLKYLGFYKTEEKAMKVLDELQCRIARTESGVYQMPEDEE